MSSGDVGIPRRWTVGFFAQRRLAVIKMSSLDHGKGYIKSKSSLVSNKVQWPKQRMQQFYSSSSASPLNPHGKSLGEQALIHA